MTNAWIFLVGQVTVTSEKDNYAVPTGEDLEITWKVNGIETQNLDSRRWFLDPSKDILATITNDAPVNKNNKTILAEGFDIRKPSTLILKNVDDRYNGGYKFRVEEDFKQYESVVTVLVTSK